MMVPEHIDMTWYLVGLAGCGVLVILFIFFAQNYPRDTNAR